MGAMSRLYFLTYSDSSPSAGYLLASSPFGASLGCHISFELEASELRGAAYMRGAAGAAGFAPRFFFIAASFDPIFFSHFPNSLM